MGNAICQCNQPREQINSYLDLERTFHDITPQVSKIQNSFRSFHAKTAMHEQAKINKEQFESKLTQYGTFISEEEMQSSISPIIIESDKKLTQSMNLPKNIYTYTFTLPPFKFKDGTIYSGNWNFNGKKEGFGINLKPDRSIYKGYWENDQISKYGTFIELNGNYYQGELKNGVAEGEGTLYVKDKLKYTGEFSNDVQNGKGVEENYEDGTVYEGDFKNGVKEGIGKLKFNDGTVYEGEFKDGEFNGKGTIKFFDKREYKGDFKEGKMNGNGVFTWENGNIYKGSYSNGQKNGYGTFYWDENQYYKGYWVNNKQHGEGTYFLNGKKLKGQFRYGKIIMKKEQ